MAHSQKLLPALKQALPALAGALSLVLAAPFPASADIASPGGGRNPCQRIQPQALLDGAWTAQTPQGPRTIRFSQNRYVQTVNGQLIDEGFFQTTPDGRFLYQVTGGPYAGQQGENRFICNGSTFVMLWPNGQTLAFAREGVGQTPPSQPSPPGQWGQAQPPLPGQGFGQPAPGATPLEGRWVWARQGRVSFGFIFQGNRFQGFYNGQIMGSGTFELKGAMLVMHHETGRDAGKTDRFACQISGNRMLLFVTDNPDDEPIPYVRQ